MMTDDLSGNASSLHDENKQCGRSASYPVRMARKCEEMLMRGMNDAVGLFEDRAELEVHQTCRVS